MYLHEPIGIFYLTLQVFHHPQFGTHLNGCPKSILEHIDPIIHLPAEKHNLPNLQILEIRGPTHPNAEAIQWPYFYWRICGSLFIQEIDGIARAKSSEISVF